MMRPLRGRCSRIAGTTGSSSRFVEERRETAGGWDTPLVLLYGGGPDHHMFVPLGMKGTNGRFDKASVAIELANDLALTLDGDRLHAFGMNTPKHALHRP